MGAFVEPDEKQVTKLDDMTIWGYSQASVAAASDWVIVPTDGVGRWLRMSLPGGLALPSVANDAALVALVAINRINGSQIIKLDDMSTWLYSLASTAAASAWVKVPTDGVGRWLRTLIPSDFRVASLTALAALDDSAFANGTRVDVASLLCDWKLVIGSAVAADGITVIAAHSGTAKWHRCKTATNYWAYQAVWHIDPAGNDENVGATAGAGNALKTHDELVRRIGPVLGLGVSTYTITFDAAYTGGLSWVGYRPASRVYLNYHGARTVLYSGSMTAGSVLQVAATNTRAKCIDAAIPTSWTLSGLIGKKMVWTSGTQSGRVGYAAKDVAAKSAEISRPIDVSTTSQGSPAVNDTFDVVDLTQINGGLDVDGWFGVGLFDLAFVGPIPATAWQSLLSAQDGCNVVIYGCTFENGTAYLFGSSFFDFLGCWFAPTAGLICSGYGGICYLEGSVFHSVLSATSTADIECYEDNYLWAPAVLASACNGNVSIASGSTLALLDMPALSTGYTVRGNEKPYLNGLLWGTGGGAYVLTVGAAGIIRYTTVPVMTFATNAALIAGTAKAYADLPYVTAAAMAGVVVYS